MTTVLLIYAVTSTLTFIAFGLDKRAAVRARSRTPESTLHVMELLGGFPGALIGMRVFRHKRRKLRYVLMLWSIITLHLVGWIAWLVFRQ